VNHSKLSDWLQVAANVGIVIGLLLVGVQLKQNSDLLKTQLLYEESHRAIDLETQVVGENGAEVWAKSITDAKSLSLAEQRVMEALLWRIRVNSETAFFLANEYGAAWWANYNEGNTALPDDLVVAINTRLSEVDNTFTANYSKAVMDLVNKSSAIGD